ncbi:hypothetical protein DPMN_192594 [Dreissena polymorpha]|uniref:Uncharacterized protein n=1 Tax=Dreissena polymorpha TaxID=45954 RepID=A0A9D3Y7D2_DREPO|nr:hypothetical protein DPMN_192594 [Dreissena polymorpha]
MSPQVNFLSAVFHVVHAHCAPISTALACRAFSFALLTSDLIIARLPFWSDRLHSTTFLAPIPSRPTAVTPTMSLCLSAFSAWLTDFVADHFLLVRVWIPASRMNSSGEPLKVNTSLAFAVLNSSASEDSGSCNLLLFP